MAASIAAAAPRQDAVIHERVTKGGRRLFYRLEVIQQPERARACGSGPKSSADRRPVDPPPVVELRVFEGGPTLEQSKDITFTYNANFFLFATLEHARVIAHGRVQTPAANTPPVLTGMPVSGMAYLDRPQEAGYFLFPDLSVRHEGRYRLSFNLYEQTKEDCDMDKEPSAQKLDGCESFDWRLEVKSNEFVVFSAKKFPGLTESTALSRTVAEQGCRVRIRRDVRMRRRDGKGGGDYDNAEDEFARRRRTQTPEAEREFRARSMSTESVQRTPYSADSQRRPSGVDYPPPPPSFGGGSQPSSGSHLTFGGQSTGHYQPQPYPREHNAQSSSVPPSPSYPPPSQGAQYPHQPPQSHGYYQERPPSQHYAAADPSPRRDSHDISRASKPFGRPITPLNVEKLDGKLEALPQFAPPSAQSGSNSISLPSIQSIAVDPQLQADCAPSMGALTSPSTDHGRAYGPLPPATHLGKRSRSDYNPTIAWNVEPQKNGTRPSEDSTPDNPREFRRANGTTRKVYMSEYGLALS